MFLIEDGELLIRPMVVADLPRIKEIRDLCLEFLHDRRSFGHEEMVRWFLEVRPPYLAVCSGGVLVGYVRLSGMTRASCYLGMDLHPEWRGRGIALRTYRLLIDELQRIGVQTIRLRVLNSNGHAKRLYEHIGFVAVADTPETTPPPERAADDCLMVYRPEAARTE